MPTERTVMMTKNDSSTSRNKIFRSDIASFIEQRRDAKLKGADSEKAAEKYEYAVWLADAARRVSQIQAVTHVLKATHPDARGSSLYVAPSELQQHAEVGSHVLGDKLDRKSTRLNSSHVAISYAVFC